MFWGILAIAGCLRFYHLKAVPPGLFLDEASIAYNAWSISRWARDEQANFLPLSFVSFGDYKPPGVIYVLAIAYRFFGFHWLWVRYLAALSGVGSVILAFLITQELGKIGWLQSHWRWWIPYLVMFGLALSPWGVTLSRVGFEQSTAFFLVNLSILGLLKGLKCPPWWLGSGLAIAASLYVFHTAKIFWLGFLPFFGFIFRQPLSGHSRWLKLSGGLLLLLSLPLVVDALGGKGLARSETLIFFTKFGVWNDFRTSLQELGGNIIRELAPEFWLRGNDAVSWRHSVKGHGLITPIGWALMWLGILIGLKNWRQRVNQLLLGWWGLGLTPAILTHLTPHALRSLFALTPAVIWATVGLISLSDWIRQKSVKLARVTLGLIGGVYLMAVAAYLKTYYQSYPTSAAQDFLYGYDQIVVLTNQYRNQAEKIVVSDVYGQPYIYFLVYNQIEPKDYLYGALNQYEFGPVKWAEHREKRLYVASPSEIPLTDPTVIKVIMIPGTEKPLWVVART